MSQSVTIRGNCPGICIHSGQSMSINKSALRLLGYPNYVQFWHSPKANTLFIGADDGTSILSFPVNDRYYRSKSGFRLQNKQLICAVQNCAKWSRHATCAVDGEYMDALGMVAFRLDNSKIKEDTSYE